ncbi:MAG: hypothetical protein HYY16_00090 [Planctomycetes bacterium]|nr:hypothetical protein [Planctomycetota bacterium]
MYRKRSMVMVWLGWASAAFAQVPVPTDLAQFQSDGVTTIAEGGEVNQAAAVTLSGTVYVDPAKTPTTVYRLEVEARPVTTAFTNTPTHTAAAWVAAGPSGATSTVLVDGLVPGVSYHWQARNRTS